MSLATARTRNIRTGDERTNHEATAPPVYKHDWGVELGSTEKQLHVRGQSRTPGLEPATFQVLRPNHSAMLPPKIVNSKWIH